MIKRQFLLAASVAGLSAALAAPAAAQQSKTGAADGQSGLANVSMCTGCHSIPGYQASFPQVYRVPKLGGQSAKYIENALQAYKKGDRAHPSMQAIAVSLSDQQIAALAAYYAERGTEAGAGAKK
jgi:cytochrome c553